MDEKLGKFIEDFAAIPQLPAFSPHPAGLQQPGHGSGPTAPGRCAGALALQLRRTIRSGPPARRQDRARPAKCLARSPGHHPAVASRLLAEVRREMEHQSVFKGQIIALAASDYRPGISRVTFIRRPELASSDVVLPAGLLARWSATPWELPGKRTSLRHADSISNAASCSTGASFAKELIRRSVVAAALAGESPRRFTLERRCGTAHGRRRCLTRSLLGSNGSGISHSPPAPGPGPWAST